MLGVCLCNCPYKVVALAVVVITMTPCKHARNAAYCSSGHRWPEKRRRAEIVLGGLVPGKGFLNTVGSLFFCTERGR